MGLRRARREQQQNDSTATLRSAVEVAAVKAQVQGLVRRLQSTLRELENEIEKLPDDEDEFEGPGELTAAEDLTKPPDDADG